MPAWYFARYSKPLAKEQVDVAQRWVQKALRQTRRSAEREFEGRGFEFVFQELGFAGLRIRARLNIRQKKVFIDPGSEADILQELDALGFPFGASPKDLLLTHELFHLFCPKCPASVAELAAHTFCVEVLDLDYFPGLLDTVDVPRLHAQTA